MTIGNITYTAHLVKSLHEQQVRTHVKPDYCLSLQIKWENLCKVYKKGSNNLLGSLFEKDLDACFFYNEIISLSIFILASLVEASPSSTYHTVNPTPDLCNNLALG
jgi:hypothetical protein